MVNVVNCIFRCKKVLAHKVKKAYDFLEVQGLFTSTNMSILADEVDLLGFVESLECL